MVTFYETSGHSMSQPFVTVLSRVGMQSYCDDVCLRQTPINCRCEDARESMYNKVE